jgi:hypothetical protein
MWCDTGNQGIRKDPRGLPPLDRQCPRPHRHHGIRAQRTSAISVGRIVARAWLRIIWACWHTNTPYNPTKHQAAQALSTRS